jgi:hypothetical protein
MKVTSLRLVTLTAENHVDVDLPIGDLASARKFHRLGVLRKEVLGVIVNGHGRNRAALYRTDDGNDCAATRSAT